MTDCLIIGGGVIGLSVAYELSRQGARVRVIDRGEPGREASWAGAGILPAAPQANLRGSLDELGRLSGALHPRWADDLRELTGIDTGYRRSGGLHITTDQRAAEVLHEQAAEWRRQQIGVQEIAPDRIAELEPAMQASRRRADDIAAAYLLPAEAQVRNPRHCAALVAACCAEGVEILSSVACEGFDVRAGRVRRVLTSDGAFPAGCVCLTGGAWSGRIARALGVSIPVEPVRGQMVLMRCAAPALRRIVNQGSRYLVPRPDGRVLVGSTEEDAGFEKRTTAEGIAGLLQLALRLAPRLAGAAIEQTWAGLRPGSPDGAPYLGRIGDLENAYVASGHFRSGLWLSTGTAVVMSCLIRGVEPPFDIAALGVDRASSSRDPIDRARSAVN